jgi:hypothetical protein
MGDIVDSGIGLSYRPASLTSPGLKVHKQVMIKMNLKDYSTVLLKVRILLQFLQLDYPEPMTLLSVHIFSEILYGKNETGKIYSHTFFFPGKKYCYGSSEGEYCHCDYCKVKANQME